MQEDTGIEGNSEQPSIGGGAGSQGIAANVTGPIPAPQPMICVGPGLAPLPRRLVERIKANEYIDFAELPPAKGKGRSIPQPGEGHFIVIQAADLVQSRKTIPDYATWSQCFALYVAARAEAQPRILRDLMGYQSLIARASKKYKWPSWVVYDQNFRQEVAGAPDQVWAKADPSLYAQCFTGQEKNSENWCGRCQGLDHTSNECPYPPRKRPWSGASGGGPNNPRGGAAGSGRSDQPCLKYNRYQGDCRFGRDCRFQHVCSNCQGAHPVSRCKAGNGPQHGPQHGPQQ